MKKYLLHFVSTNIFSKFIRTTVIVALLSGSVAITANAKPASASAETGPGGIGKTEITHAGTNSQSIFFDVKVENSEGKRFLIFVKDENGNTLYRGVYNSKDFSKRFVVPRLDSNKITFVIKGESDNKSESFEINSNTRVIEEVVVRKMR